MNTIEMSGGVCHRAPFWGFICFGFAKWQVCYISANKCSVVCGMQDKYDRTDLVLSVFLYIGNAPPASMPLVLRGYLPIVCSPSLLPITK